MEEAFYVLCIRIMYSSCGPLSRSTAQLYKLLTSIGQWPACAPRSLLHQSAISLADFVPGRGEGSRPPETVARQFEPRASASPASGHRNRNITQAGRDYGGRDFDPTWKRRNRLDSLSHGTYQPSSSSRNIPRNETELCQALTDFGERRQKGVLKRVFDSCLAAWERNAAHGGPRISHRTLLVYLSQLVRVKEPMVGLKAVTNRVKKAFGIASDLAVYNKILEGCHAAKEPAHMAMSILDEMQAQGVLPNMESYMWAFTSCVRNFQHEPAIRVLALLREAGLESPSPADRQDLVSGLQALLVNLSKGGSPEGCLQVTAAMQELGFQPQPHLLQECMQTAVASHKPDAALKFLNVLADLPSPVGRREGVQIVEGQCLALLNCAALHGHAPLAREAWSALQATLQGPPQVSEGRDPVQEVRRPLAAFYHAYIHALAASGDLRGAFQMIGELEAAYPGWPEAVAWHGALGCMVDACARSREHVDQAYYHLESMLANGEVVSQAMADCVLAACSQMGDVGRAFETFEAYAKLQLRPGANTYNAVLSGCIQNNLLESVPKILAEMNEMRVAYNAQTRALLVTYHVVERDPEGILEALDDMAAHQQQPSLELLESAMARLEREGHREGIQRLSQEVGTSNWRAFNALNKVARWKDNGGMVALTNSHRFVLRPHDAQSRQLDRILS